MAHGIHFLANTSEQRKQLDTFLATWHAPNPYIEVKTSGSTGEPKIIQLSKEACINSAKRTLNYFGLNPGDSAYLCLSLDTIAGKMMVIRSLIGNLKLYVGSVSRDSLLDLTESVKFAAIVPLQLAYTLEHSPKQLSKIENILVGGAGINSEQINLLHINKLTVYQSYGMTETLSHVAIKRSGFSADSFYTALPGVELQEKDGVLVINDQVTGILDLKTTDSIELISSNTFRFIGRTNLMINSGGIKMAAESIETLCSPYIRQPFFVTGTPDKEFGECVTLVIESKTPVDVMFPDSTFPAYHRPRKTIVIPSFAYTSSGKIDRLKTMANWNNNSDSKSS